MLPNASTMLQNASKIFKMRPDASKCIKNASKCFKMRLMGDALPWPWCIACF
jgi:hypothetical protein